MKALCLLLASLVASAASASDLEVRFVQRDAPAGVQEVVFADVPAAAVPAASQPVAPGLAFDEGPWPNAHHIDGFNRPLSKARLIARGLSAEGSETDFMKQGLKPDLRTEAFLLHDPESLYVGFRCWEEESRSLVVEPTQKRDSAVWGADSCEIFISPWNDDSLYFHIISDSRGTMYDARNVTTQAGRGKQSDKAWNSNTQVAVKTLGDHWILQFKIPLADLGLRPGEKFRLNLCRSRIVRGKPELCAWAIVEEGFHETQCFGEAVLGEAAAAPAAKLEKIVIPAPMWGDNAVSVFVRGAGNIAVNCVLDDARGAGRAGVSRQVMFRDGSDVANVEMPYRLGRAGDYALHISLATDGGEILEKRRLNVQSPPVLDVQCADAFYSTNSSGSAGVSLNVATASLGEISLRIAIKANGEVVANREVSQVDAQRAYVDFNLDKLGEDVPCQLTVEVVEKSTGRTIDEQTVSFRRIAGW